MRCYINVCVKCEFDRFCPNGQVPKHEPLRKKDAGVVRETNGAKYNRLTCKFNEFLFGFARGAKKEKYGKNRNRYS